MMLLKSDLEFLEKRRKIVSFWGAIVFSLVFFSFLIVSLLLGAAPEFMNPWLFSEKILSGVISGPRVGSYAIIGSLISWIFFAFLLIFLPILAFFVLKNERRYLKIVNKLNGSTE